MLSRDRLNTDRLSTFSPPTAYIQLPECPWPKCPTGLDFPDLRVSGWGVRVPGRSIPGAQALTQAFPGEAFGSDFLEFLALASGATCPALLVTAPGLIDYYCLDELGYKNIYSASACLKMPSYSCVHMSMHAHTQALLAMFIPADPVLLATADWTRAA